MHVADASLREELEQLRRHAQRLEQSLMDAQRLAMLGQLSCRMAHEFNNILMMIMGRASHSLKYGDPDLKDKALEKAVECGQRAADIVASLLGYATNRQMQSLTVSARDLVEATVNLIAWDLPKSGIEVRCAYDFDARVRVIPVRIEQVLLNLILNARNAMRPRGGRLLVGVSRPDTPGYVALTVEDTGYGIPPEHLDRIFDAFFSTRPRSADGRAESGTGLGLSVARDLVHQAGGEIRVRSTPGVGSTFSVLLPIAEPPCE